MQALAITPVSQVAPAAKGQSSDHAPEDAGSFEDAMIAQEETEAVASKITLETDDVDVALPVLPDGEETESDSVAPEVPEAEIAPLPSELIAAPEEMSDSEFGPADSLLARNEPQKAKPLAEGVEFQKPSVEQGEKVATTIPPETGKLASPNLINADGPPPKPEPATKQPAATVLKAPAPIQVDAATAPQSLTEPQVFAASQQPSQTLLAHTNIPVAPEQLFRLQPTSRDQSGTRFELSWPSDGPEIETVQIRAAPKTTVRPATPVQTHIEAIFSNDIKNLNLASPDKLIDTASLGIDAETGRMRTESAPTTQSIIAVAQSRAELPANVARQIAEVVQRAPGRAVELSLSPAELGSVRMKLSPADVGMVVSIFAERPETLDLMRRNIEALERAITDLGYENVAFSFDTAEGSQEFSDQAPDGNGSGLPPEGNPTAAPEEATAQSTILRHSGSMDVRV